MMMISNLFIYKATKIYKNLEIYTFDERLN